MLFETKLASAAILTFMDEPTTDLDFISRKELYGVMASIRHDQLIILTVNYFESSHKSYALRISDNTYTSTVFPFRSVRYLPLLNSFKSIPLGTCPFFQHITTCKKSLL